MMTDNNDLFPKSASFNTQFCAIIYKCAITSWRYKIVNFIDLIFIPVIFMSVLLYMQFSQGTVPDELKIQFEPVGGINIEIVFLFFSYIVSMRYIESLSSDLQGNFKRLMTMMGLKYPPYYIANLIWFLVQLLPSMIFLDYMYVTCSFKGTSAYVTITIFSLFFIQLSAFINALCSLQWRNNFLLIILIIQPLYVIASNSLLKWIEDDYLDEIVLFFVCSSPFRALRLYGDSWVDPSKQNNNDAPIRKSSFLNALYMLSWTVLLYGIAIYRNEKSSFSNSISIMKSDKDSLNEACDDECSRGSRYFERYSETSKTGLRLIQLNKSFDSVPVVRDVNLRIFEGETTLLLGHNGAGKTTLMNMILGNIEPDEGRVVTSELNYNKIGICPQQSIVNQHLSVWQHLRLFAMIKTSSDHTSNINQTLCDVGLVQHDHKLPQHLSGGMLRKLSLGMALVAGSRTLILDEPSSGLDPDSRVFIWNTIRRYRANRTVLLSSQHMEEADYLGDRIAIMSRGTIICCGSSLFLKKVFGTGYRFRFECSNSERQTCLKIVKQYFPQATESMDDMLACSVSGKEDQISSIVMNLSPIPLEDPQSTKNHMSKLIGLLEHIEKNNTPIVSYGLRAPSMEDVLLNTGRHFRDKSGDSNIEIDDEAMQHSIESIITTPKTLTSNSTLFRILLIKNIYYLTNTPINSILQRIVIPAFMIAYLTVHSFRYSRETEYTPYHFVIVLSICVSVVANYPILEDSKKFKAMLLSSKANFIHYWSSMLLIDVAIFATIYVISVNLTLVFLISEKNNLAIIHLTITSATILMTISSCLYVYIIVKLTCSAQAVLGFLNMGNIMTFSSLFLKLIIFLVSSNKNNPFWDNLHTFIGRLSATICPLDSYAFVIYGLRYGGYIGLPQNYPAEFFSPLIYGHICLLAQVILFGALLLYIEKVNFHLIRCKWLECSCTSNYELQLPIVEDEDVVEESSRAMDYINGDCPDNVKLVAENLTKSHIKGYPVVKNLSFTVKNSECFGLLGINGAGKSTTFSMLVGDRNPDSGNLLLNGTYSISDISNYRSQVGYDPQNVLDVQLSVKQALKLIAQLRLVDELRIDGLITDLLHVVDALEHRDKMISSLSGGTKKKLAFAMSLVGNPALLALDEPTAGVDPMARRRIWTLLNNLRVKNNTSIVISSHAMEECEAICQRISIMSRGMLRCVGTFLHLRSKFARGCNIKISHALNSRSQVDIMNIDSLTTELIDLLKDYCGTFLRLEDKNANSATIFIDADLCKSKLLRILEQFSDKHEDINYILNDTSMENVFKKLAEEGRQT